MGMLGQDFANIYARELDRLADEVAAYGTDEDLWSTLGAQKNAPGTLAIHTVGALNTFIGAGLGDTGYVRDRDAEFGERGLSRAGVIDRIRACRDSIVPILAGLDDAVMSQQHPGDVPERLRGMTTHAFLTHLIWHVGWHQGHIYYHRLGMHGSSEE